MPPRRLAAFLLCCAAHGAARPAGLRRGVQQHDRIRFRFHKSNAIYRWELLRDEQIGIGIAYVFVRQVEADIAAGRLVPVLPSCWPAFTGFHLSYPTRKQRLCSRYLCELSFVAEVRRIVELTHEE